MSGRRDKGVGDIDISLGEEQPKKIGRHLPRERKEGSFRTLPTKRKVFTIVKIALLFAAAAGLVAFVYAYAGNLTSSNIRRFFRYVGNGFQPSAESVEIGVTVSSGMKTAVWQDGVCTVSVDGLHIYTPDGDDYQADSTGFSSPIIGTTGKYIMAADSGGTTFIVSDGEKTVLNGSTTSQIINARITGDGLAVMTAEKGYLAGVSAYNSSLREALRYRTSDYYGVDAVMAGGGSTLAFLGVSASGTAIKSTLLLIDVSAAEVKATIDLGEALPEKLLLLGDGTICAVTDESASFVGADGTYLGAYDFGASALRAACATSGCAVFALDLGTAGLSTSIVTVDTDGTPLAERQESIDLLGLAAGSDTVGLLFTDRIELCDIALKKQGERALSEKPDSIAASGDGVFAAIAGSSAVIASR